MPDTSTRPCDNYKPQLVVFNATIKSEKAFSVYQIGYVIDPAEPHVLRLTRANLVSSTPRNTFRPKEREPD